MKNINICYIGGGSKDWARKYFSDLLLQNNIGGEIRLYDIDHKASSLNKRYFDRLVKANKDKINTNWECVVIDNIDEALTNSDVVLISILPYSLKNMAVDVHYAEKYGIYQSVGDTVGVGGYSRALRTLPAMKFFALKIKENCPNAWVINYTNPMSMCVNALYEFFPEIKCFGCCHEVFRAQKLISGVYGLYEKLDEEGKKAFMESNYEEVLKTLKRAKLKFDDYKKNYIDRHEISTNVIGVNHFTLITTATYQNKDILPIYLAFIPMFKKHNKLKDNYVQYDMYERYGIIGAAGDRHLAEFQPEFYLPLNKKHYHYEQGFKLTTVRFRIIQDKFRRFRLKVYASGLLKPKIKPTGEEGVLQIQALYGFKDLISNANLLNHGQVEGLPLNTAVETNCLFSLNDVKVLDAGSINNDYLLERESLHSKNQYDFVKAFFKQDKKALLEVFLSDPQVKRIGKEKGTNLFNELINLNKDVLEDWIIK